MKNTNYVANVILQSPYVGVETKCELILFKYLNIKKENKLV